MLTPPNKTFAHISNGLLHSTFTSVTLPEYNENTFIAVDITSLSPQPQIGWTATEANGAWSFNCPSSDQLWTAYRANAMAALVKTDDTMARIAEAVSLGTSAWTNADVVAFVNYRRALRTIASASTGDPTQAMPAKPVYPAGT